MRRSPSPALSLGGREARSPLGKKTCDGISERRFRFPRRPQSAFLLPEGEGQDEGEGGLQRPSRGLLFENPLPWLYPLKTSRNPKIQARRPSLGRETQPPPPFPHSRNCQTLRVLRQSRRVSFWTKKRSPLSQIAAECRVPVRTLTKLRTPTRSFHG